MAPRTMRSLIILLLWNQISYLGAGAQQQQKQAGPADQGTQQLGSKALPHVQPGCTVMYLPGQACVDQPSPFVKGCCTPGHVCAANSASRSGRSCQPVPQSDLQYTFEQQAKGGCAVLVDAGGQCGGAGFDCYKYNTCNQFGPWGQWCCPNGYSCRPAGQDFRLWTCQVDVQDAAPVDATQEVLQYPPRPLPAGSCTCRLDMDKQRVPMDCPSPWANVAGTSMVPPALKLAAGGMLLAEGSNKPAVLRGINWFGWSVGSFNFDGLYAYCDDNSTSNDPPCQQDGDIPPWLYPSAAIGGPAQKRLGFSFWKRSMTTDFAMVVYRIKLLGFNAIRVQFKFSDLNQDIPEPKNNGPEFHPCMLDEDDYIAAMKTMDPLLIEGLGSDYSLEALRRFLPPYKGMRHPPPKTGSPACDKPWSAPFLGNYTSGRGKRLRFTMCNWYLPQGPGVPAIYRFVWQLQYLVSQGFYVLLDFSSTRDAEPNVSDGAVLARNWANLWRILADIPTYKTHLRGRIFPDVINEPSRWGCQWTSSCQANGTTVCAPTLHTLGQVAAAIWEVDPTVPLFLNGLGQDYSNKYTQCGKAYPGMHWGDGFVTNSRAVEDWGISTPSDMFTTPLTEWVGPSVRVEQGAAQTPRFVLAPHIYPTSVTGAIDEMAAAIDTITYRWDQSWGWKMQGLDTTMQGSSIPAMAVVIGESGAKDSGDNSVSNSDTTQYLAPDKAWLDIVAAYLRTLSERTGRQPSWFFWAWNANSGDTKGIVGPQTTWREVQWTKVRMLIRNYGLRPWYCDWWPDFCDTVEW